MVTSKMAELALVLAVVGLAMPWFSRAVDINQMRQLAAKSNVSCVLVFGDSSVDPGNNNRLSTDMKGNFPPYGKDFFDGRPTGRFSNGRLATDFVAEGIGYTMAIPAFLDPHLKPTDLIYGVSFASAASGYDELTANLSSVLPVSEQLEYFKHYKLHLAQLVGEKQANIIVGNAMFVMSMGTNDFLQNYFLEPIRSKEYTIEDYQNYLASRLFDDFKQMHKLGATKLVVVGVPPLGCMPLVRTLMGQSKCVESYNQVAFSFNSKIKQKLADLRSTLGIKAVYADCYSIIAKAIQSPKDYGLEETSKGCCGTGTVEYGITCRGLSTCADRSKYVFWDAVHPTEKMYQIIAEEIIRSLKEAALA